ncbi:PhnA domain-containing protein [Campylobacter ureolyticus]|uniref:PhnA domain-containing protein n=1 Tax=Campylobacter ureolyticus TaxID=827 RepID=A0AAE7EB28_9BACT|nr:PhnA domain-containing protein [Campylobacter ureolyticus]MCR8684533.1 PhnA domain-containing protein [Campylobacter ureolyticus]MDU5326591.1 PhnA domain-containing protein [Campylobacter ureolyticus]QKF84929.1 PhnA domain-containing protein [Campylobacter ureolyticus]QQY34906.1 PhnA domain-containing protein [Campylobacter ureolyticus]SUX20554.1 Protein phnA [Campylobacter ureolyticus]
MAVVDVNGVELQSGDNIVVIKDLKLKSSKNSVKQGTKAKIRLTKNENEVECKLDKLGTVILKTEFIRKA